MFAVALPAWAQQYRFDHWTTDNGLPQNTVRSVVKTRDGYLWFTTFDGLARFDGLNFRVFNKANSPGLSSNRLTRLQEAPDGALYIATEKDGLVLYRRGVFQAYTRAEGYPSRFNCDFQIDPHGEMLIRTVDNGGFYLRDGKFAPAPAEYFSSESSSYRVRSGAVWTAEREAVTRRSQDGALRRYSLPADRETFVPFNTTLYEDRSGSLWAFRGGAGLFRVQGDEVRRVALPGKVAARPFGEDREGGVWFVQNLQEPQVRLLRFENERFTVYGEADGVPQTGITALVPDDEGNVWLGTNAGLFRMRRQLVTTFSEAQGLAAKEVYPLLQTGGGDILVGTIRGLNVFRGGKFTTLPLKPAPLVQALTEDRQGRWWIGKSGGLLRYDQGRAQDFSELVDSKPGVPGAQNNVTALLADRRGHVWAGTLRGLYEFDGDRVANHYTTDNGLPGNEVVALLESRDGALWIGAYGGLARLKDGQLTVYTAAQGLAGNRVRALHEDPDGTLWIGAYDEGLSRLKDGQFTSYRESDGLFNNGVFAILPDKQGNFWMSCNKGIYRVRRQELDDFANGKIAKINSVAYSKADGMWNVECNGGRQPAGLVARDGHLWFPTQDGVAVIDPEAERFNPLAPPVVIETVTVDRQTQNAPPAVEVGAGQSNLEIAYAGLSFLRPEQVKFRYQLVGQDAAWVDAGTRRTAYYSYLPPGEYTFRVIAANAEGVWNLEGAQMQVRVLAPFYRQAWFWALCALALAGATIAFFRRRERRASERQAAQEAFARQLIEAQEEERKRIAAGLHDSLGQVLLIIKNRAFLGQRAAGGAGEPPAKLTAAEQQFGEISAAANDAIEQVSEIAYYLRPSQLERLGLAAAIEEMLNQVEDASGIQFDFAADELHGALPPKDEINFFRIVQESVNNVVKHSGATRAEVTVKRSGQTLELRVADNGQGFDAQRPARTGRASGFGLTGMAERTKILGGHYSIKSKPGEGTTVSVKIETG
jgi:signal transduction histidine kinase/ligand-binding sensor domain-containing protein